MAVVIPKEPGKERSILSYIEECRELLEMIRVKDEERAVLVADRTRMQEILDAQKALIKERGWRDHER